MVPVPKEAIANLRVSKIRCSRCGCPLSLICEKQAARESNLISLHFIFLKSGDVLRVRACESCYDYVGILEFTASFFQKSGPHCLSQAATSHCRELSRNRKNYDLPNS
jgi:hypothetical protein